MDRLWAPWRLAYVKSDKSDQPADFISHVDGESNDRENLVVLRTDSSIVILNRFPYNNGHVLVAPRRAVADLEDLTDEESLDLQRTLVRVVRAMKSFLNPEGFNIGLNLGRVAGAGVPNHLHWHVVPRWSGDTNFMTVMSDVSVIIQSLDDLWVRLRGALDLPVEDSGQSAGNE